MTVCVMLAFANAAAVSVTVKAVVTVAGAVYVTPAVVEFDSVPQLLTGQLVRLHRTPAFNGPPVTVAVKFAESPGSIVSLPGPVIVTPVGLLLPPPQPLRVDAIARRQRGKARRQIAARALRFMKGWVMKECLRIGLRTGGPRLWLRHRQCTPSAPDIKEPAAQISAQRALEDAGWLVRFLAELVQTGSRGEWRDDRSCSTDDFSNRTGRRVAREARDPNIS